MFASDIHLIYCLNFITGSSISRTLHNHMYFKPQMMFDTLSLLLVFTTLPSKEYSNKYSGITLTCNLSWSSHINQSILKQKCLLGLIYHYFSLTLLFLFFDLSFWFKSYICIMCVYYELTFKYHICTCDTVWKLKPSDELETRGIYRMMYARYIFINTHTYIHTYIHRFDWLRNPLHIMHTE